MKGSFRINNSASRLETYLFRMDSLNLRKNRTKLNGQVVFELGNRHTSTQLEHLKKTWNGHTEN